jgi:hypothetical protein
MARPRPPRPEPRKASIAAIARADLVRARLRTELTAKMDRLRATIEAKRRIGWHVVRNSPSDDAAESV